MPLFKKKKKIQKKKGLQKFNRRVLSLSQLLRRQRPYSFPIQQTPIRPIIPPKSFVIILKRVQMVQS